MMRRLLRRTSAFTDSGGGGGGITLRGAGVENEDSEVTSIVLTFHEDWEENDVVIAALLHNRASTTINESGSAWTKIGEDTAQGFSEAIFRRVLTSGDISTGSVTFQDFTGGAGDNIYVAAFAWSGVNTSTPEAATTTEDTGNSDTAIAVDIGTIDSTDMAVAIAVAENSTFTPVTAGWTDLGSTVNSGGSFGFHWMTKIGAAPGSFTWSLTSTRWATYMAGLNSA